VNALTRPRAAASEATRPERRATPRLVPAVLCRVRLDGPTELPEGTLLDVSRAGAGVRLPAQARTATLPSRPTVATLTWAGGALSVGARVVWDLVDPDGSRRVGLAFPAPLAHVEVPTLLDLKQVRIDPVWALKVPSTLAMRRLVLPFAEVDGEVFVACANLSDSAALAAVEKVVERPVRALPADVETLRRAIQRIHGDPVPTAAADPENPVALCNELLHAAWLRRASDVHVDPGSDGVRVRLRVDGELEDYRRLPFRAHAELLSRIKVLGRLDIAEKRAPQDGRFTHSFGDEQVDVRVATLPTKYGERATLRLLASSKDARTLEDLGMSARDLATYSDAIRRPHGLLLATGPTGSGKTTTLYAALQRIIAQSPVNVITVEDPIEYDVPGVAQVEVDPAQAAAQQKVSFARAIRAILRHDPDVLMIAEIRDGETVDVAMKAALTGHLVLSTLHTNSAVSAITRLDDMGVERYLTAATLRLSMSQRLARRLCPHCRRAVPLDAARARALGRAEAEGTTVYEPVGCAYCAGRGYSGRVGLFELISVDEALSREIASGVDESRLVEILRERKTPRMIDDAVEKLGAGTTSVAEVLAAVAI
jgi:general secretion pathway protein E